MSETSPQEIIDIPTLDRIAKVLQIRDADSPEDGRAAVINDLWRIRNMLAHDGGPTVVLATEGITDAQVATLLAGLVQLEMTSLGTASARDVRARATAGRVAEILLRHENYRDEIEHVPAEGAAAHHASGTVHDGGGGHHHELHQRAQKDAELSCPAEATTAASPDEIVSDADWPSLKPDPRQAKTAPELVEVLRAFRTWAGEPSYREMARRAAGLAAASTLHTALANNHLPGLQVVTALVIGCGGTEEDQRQFSEAWQLIQLRQLAGLTELNDADADERFRNALAPFVQAMSRPPATGRGAPASEGEASA